MQQKCDLFKDSLYSFSCLLLQYSIYIIIYLLNYTYYLLLLIIYTKQINNYSLPHKNLLLSTDNSKLLQSVNTLNSFRISNHIYPKINNILHVKR